MSTYDALKQKVREIAAMRTAGERAVAKSEIIALIQALEGEHPAAPNALRNQYEAGFLAAMELLRQTQRDLAAPIKKAFYGEDLRHAAGAMVWTHSCTMPIPWFTQFEIRATRALRPPKKETT